jgi:hypothetical protein
MPRRRLVRRVQAGIAATAVLALGSAAAVALGQEGGAAQQTQSTGVTQSVSTSTTIVVSNGTTQTTSSGTGTPATTTPVTATPRVRRSAGFAPAGRRLQVTRAWTVVVGTVSCPQDAASCPSVAASLTRGGIAIARGGVTARPGQQRVLRIRLGKAARSRLRRAGSLAVRLSVTRGSGIPATRRAVVLRAPAR